MFKNLAKMAMIAAVFWSVPSVAEESQFDAISVAVGKYMDGTENGRPELLEEVMLPSLEVQWVSDDGELVRRPAPEFIDFFRDGQFRDRNARIISIDTTQNGAVVKVELEFNQRKYTDYLLMLKIGGEWKISNKIVTWVELAKEPEG